MNPEEPDKTLAVGKPKEIRVVEDAGQLSYLFDTARFEHMFRIAEAMSNASLLPDHLLGNKHGDFTALQKKANCFLIVNQAIRWGMDPFAVMPETYVVGGKLAYQGKLVAAVVNSKADLLGRLKYRYKGTKGKDDFTVTVSGRFYGETDPSEIELSVGDAKTQNDMWRKDPEQKLAYSGVVKWARRYCPEIVLGVVTDDDLERIAERLPEKPAKARAVTKPDFSKEALERDFARDSAPANTNRTEGGDDKREASITTSPEAQSAETPAPDMGHITTTATLGPGELLVTELMGRGINQQTFVEDAKLVFQEIPKRAKIVQDLSPEVVAACLKAGIDAVMDDAKWLKPQEAAK